MSSIQLYKIVPGTSERKPLGALTQDQVDFLVVHLEEEFEEDTEYYISPPTLDYLRTQGADEGLLSLLEKALEEAGDGVEIAYQRGQ